MDKLKINCTWGKTPQLSQSTRKSCLLGDAGNVFHLLPVVNSNHNISKIRHSLNF